MITRSKSNIQKKRPPIYQEGPSDDENILNKPQPKRRNYNAKTSLPNTKIRSNLQPVTETVQSHIFSPEAVKQAWIRTKHKFYLTEGASPIKQIPNTLKVNEKLISNDARFSGLIWILSNSEQYHYDNSIKLNSFYLDDSEHLRKALACNYSPRSLEDYMNDWTNIEVLGSGTFGDVIKVYDKQVDKIFAIKLIKKTKSTTVLQRARALLEYFKERNHLIKARNSPLIMQFYSSFESEKYSRLIMVYDYCIGDLNDYETKLVPKIDEYYVFDKMVIEGDQEQYDLLVSRLLETISFNVILVHSIWIFECFMILDYFAKSNLIHNDIKELNILITETGHLKMADFGLITNTEFVTNGNHLQLIDLKKLHGFKEAEPKISGTYDYYDLELLMEHVKIYKLEKTMDKVSDPKIPYDSDTRVNYNQCFMSDVWSMNLVIFALTIFGVDFVEEFSKETMKRFGLRNKDFRNAIMALTNSKRYYNSFFRTGYKNMVIGQFGDLADLIVSSFEIRTERCKNFRKRKTVRMCNKTQEMDYLAIEEVEKLQHFTRLGIDRTSTPVFQMPREVFAYITKSTNKGAFPTFDAFLKKSDKCKLQKSYMPIRPGVDISFPII